MDVSLLIARGPRFRDHATGPHHPERPERMAAVDAALDGVEHVVLEPRPATDAELEAVHGPSYLERLERFRGRDGQLDPDTPVGPESIEVARLAAGTTVELASRIMRGEARAGFAALRPPGHHAMPDAAMGFCLLGNAAIAAKHLLDSGQAERIAIYDWDVHHGNGTQAAFYSDPRVLFMSTHQFPFYPGTGARSETGAGLGEGFTLNVPLPGGAGDAELLRATDEIFTPRVFEFQPDIVLVSAGFDAHVDDPVGGMRATSEGFAALAERWRGIAERNCDGRILGVLEGGYDLDALTASVRATLSAWA